MAVSSDWGAYQAEQLSKELDSVAVSIECSRDGDVWQRRYHSAHAMLKLKKIKDRIDRMQVVLAERPDESAEDETSGDEARHSQE